MIKSTIHKPNKTVENRLFVQTQYIGDGWVLRKEGDYENNIAEFQKLEEAITAARKYMDEHKIYKLAVCFDNGKVQSFEETSKSRRKISSKIPTIAARKRIRKYADYKKAIAVNIPVIKGRRTVKNIVF